MTFETKVVIKSNGPKGIPRITRIKIKSTKTGSDAGDEGKMSIYNG